MLLELEIAVACDEDIYPFLLRPCQQFAVF